MASGGTRQRLALYTDDLRNMSAVNRRDKLLQCPNMIRQTRFHGGRDTQACMDTAEIVVREMQIHSHS
jgi:hypothetical protein